MPKNKRFDGALKDPVDLRDYRAELLGAVMTVDWSQEYRLADPPINDQDGSLSCVAQAWSYYHWQLKERTIPGETFTPLFTKPEAEPISETEA